MTTEVRTVKRINRRIAVLAVVFPLVALIAGTSLSTVVSIAVGGLLATLNFAAIAQISSRVVRGSVRAQSLLMSLLVAKMSVLMVAIYILVRMLGVDAVGFVIGLTTLALGLLGEGLRLALSSDGANA